MAGHKRQFSEQTIKRLMKEGRIKDNGATVKERDHFFFSIRADIPPSVNHYTELGRDGARKKTPNAIAYQEKIGKIAKAAGWILAEGKMQADVYVYADEGRIDLDNVLKCLADGLQGICYRDDAQIWKWTVERLMRPPTERNPYIVINLSRYYADLS